MNESLTSRRFQLPDCVIPPTYPKGRPFPSIQIVYPLINFNFCRLFCFQKPLDPTIVKSSFTREGYLFLMEKSEQDAVHSAGINICNLCWRGLILRGVSKKYSEHELTKFDLFKCKFSIFLTDTKRIRLSKAATVYLPIVWPYFSLHFCKKNCLLFFLSISKSESKSLL